VGNHHCGELCFHNFKLLLKWRRNKHLLEEVPWNIEQRGGRGILQITHLVFFQTNTFRVQNIVYHNNVLFTALFYANSFSLQHSHLQHMLHSQTFKLTAEIFKQIQRDFLDMTSGWDYTMCVNSSVIMIIVIIHYISMALFKSLYMGWISSTITNVQDPPGWILRQNAHLTPAY